MIDVDDERVTKIRS